MIELGMKLSVCTDCFRRREFCV